MEELMIKIENVSKQYKLGEIGGTTLRDELQRRSARRHGREDPTRKIGAKNYNKGEIFKALDGVSFDVKKGERVGIIGHNGAGKSTLLKLISRVTAPSGGRIGLNGRVASMLEVGTGFHGELTGRENVYMNGAILGMTRKEIDAKIKDIIDFSECRQFIDTPVKRYSSGMYVKLAFSVAAHLDSEIMIMDEVLAVGDMAFQKKCLDKMSDVSRAEGRTILYVSHNMNTIRQLCDRVIVLDQGKVVFDGDVEEGIGCYVGINNTSSPIVNLENLPRENSFKNEKCVMTTLEIDAEQSSFDLGSKVNWTLLVKCKEKYSNCVLKVFFLHNGVPITTMESNEQFSLDKAENTIRFQVDLDGLAPSKYTTKLLLCMRNEFGGVQYLDVLMDCYIFEIVEPEDFHNCQKWNTTFNGFLMGRPLRIMNGV